MFVFTKTEGISNFSSYANWLFILTLRISKNLMSFIVKEKFWWKNVQILLERVQIKLSDHNRSENEKWKLRKWEEIKIKYWNRICHKNIQILRHFTLSREFIEVECPWRHNIYQPKAVELMLRISQFYLQSFIAPMNFRKGRKINFFNQNHHWIALFNSRLFSANIWTKVNSKISNFHARKDFQIFLRNFRNDEEEKHWKLLVCFQVSGESKFQCLKLMIRQQ